MPATCLPDHANLEHLAKQARRLQRAVRAGEPDAIARVREFHPRPVDPAGFTRSDALLTVARGYGFASWPALRHHVEAVAAYTRAPHEVPAITGDGPPAHADEFARLACLTYGGDQGRPANETAARRLLAEHPDLVAAGLPAAAAAGDVAAVATHLAAGAGPDAESGPFRWAPLLYATYSRVGDEDGRSTVEVARLLLDRGADPDAGFLWLGLTPAFTALTGVFGGGEGAQPPHPRCAELAKLLLERGANPNDDQTLYNRIFTPADDHLDLLLPYDVGRGTPGPWAARLGAPVATPAEMLADHFRFAVSSGYADRVRRLLDHGVDPDTLGTNHPVLQGLTPYEIAQREGHDEIVALLEAAGTTGAPDPVLRLGGAASRGDRARVGALLADHPGLAGRAIARAPDLVVRAAERGSVDGVRLLAELGFDVSLRSPVAPRGTPLHAAAAAGHDAVVTALLALGADPLARDGSYDAVPHGWAVHCGHPSTAALLPPG